MFIRRYDWRSRGIAKHLLSVYSVPIQISITMPNMQEIPSLRVSPSVSGPDAFWWLVDAENNPMVINIMLQSDGVWTPADLKKALEKPIADNIRLRAYPKWSGLCWRWEEVMDFSIENHIRIHTLAEPTEEALTAFVDDEVRYRIGAGGKLKGPGGGGGLEPPI